MGSIEPLALIETMAFRHHIHFLEAHLERMKRSAAFFGVRFDQTRALHKMEALLKNADQSMGYRIRLMLHMNGKFAGVRTPLNREKGGVRNVCIAKDSVDASDPFLYHKTTRRQMYEKAYKQAIDAGFDEILFFNKNGLLTEASRNNVLIRLGTQIYTPPLHCGLLDGIYRRHLLHRFECITEKELDMDALQQASAIYLCNSVRGLRKVKELLLTANFL